MRLVIIVKIIWFKLTIIVVGKGKISDNPANDFYDSDEESDNSDNFDTEDSDDFDTDDSDDFDSDDSDDFDSDDDSDMDDSDDFDSDSDMDDSDDLDSDNSDSDEFDSDEDSDFYSDDYDDYEEEEDQYLLKKKFYGKICEHDKTDSDDPDLGHANSYDNNNNDDDDFLSEEFENSSSDEDDPTGSIIHEYDTSDPDAYEELHYEDIGHAEICDMNADPDDIPDILAEFSESHSSKAVKSYARKVAAYLVKFRNENPKYKDQVHEFIESMADTYVSMLLDCISEGKEELEKSIKKPLKDFPVDNVPLKLRFW